MYSNQIHRLRLTDSDSLTHLTHKSGQLETMSCSSEDYGETKVIGLYHLKVIIALTKGKVYLSVNLALVGDPGQSNDQLTTQLTTRNSQLTIDKYQLGTDRNQLKTRNSQLTADRYQLATDKYQLITHNCQLTTRN